MNLSVHPVPIVKPTHIRPSGIAITPDGSRVYVSNVGSTSLDIDSVSIISTQTDTVIDTTTLGSATAPGGIAITPDGKRAYFTSFENKIMIIDTDPDSLLYNLVVDSINISPLLLWGSIDVSPDGKNAVVNWKGAIAHAVDVIDVDPSSTAYNTLIGSIVPVISGTSGSVAFSSDSKTSSFCGLCMADLGTYDVMSSYSDLNTGGGIALTPDDIYLLHSDINDTKLYIFDASDLTLIGNVDFETELGNDIAITPDGTRAYIQRNPVSVSSEVVMVPLQ